VYAAYQALTSTSDGSSTGDDEEPPSPGTHTIRLHGTVHVADTRLDSIVVTAWGHTGGDFHETTTDALGIYQLTELDAESLYNVVVNAGFESGDYRAIDPSRAFEVRDNVELVSGPDGWHGEDFDLAY
jgi:hypothetical protein